MAAKQHGPDYEPTLGERRREAEARAEQERRETADAEDYAAWLVTRHVPHPAGFVFARATRIRQTDRYRVNFWCERGDVGYDWLAERYVGDSRYVRVPEGGGDFEDLTVGHHRPELPCEFAI